MRTLTNTHVSLALISMLAFFAAISQRSSAEDASAQNARSGEAESEPRATMVDMPSGSVSELQLIGNTGNRRQRKWLVEDLDSRDLMLMNRQFARVGAFAYWPYFNMRVWDHELTYKTGRAAKYNDLFGWVFPKWHACQGQVAVFLAMGFSTSPGHASSGFFLIPYAPDARDYRCPGWDEIVAMIPEDSERFRDSDASFDENRVSLERAIYAFDDPPPDDCGGDQKLIVSLHRRPCTGYDFLLNGDQTGIFFLGEKVFRMPWVDGEFVPAPAPENLPSRMIVLDYRMREEREWKPRFKKPEDVAAEQNQTASGPTIRADGLVIGLPSEDARPKRGRYVPDSVVTLKWTQDESFQVPFSVPFTAAVDGDNYFFVTNDGRIYRASPAQGDGAERTVQRIFDNADDPIIACIHDSSTNRIFAFRRSSYILVDNAHFPHGGTPQFSPCEDVTQPKAMTYVEEDQTVHTPDERFQLVSRCANVLHKAGVLESRSQ